jgi:hypothetical protein
MPGQAIQAAILRGEAGLDRPGSGRRLGGMKSKIVLTLAALTLAVILPACKQESKPDASKYAELCAEVARCDKKIGQIPNGEQACGQMMAGIEEKYPAKLPELTACITSQSCETKDVSVCFAQVVQAMGLPAQ